METYLVGGAVRDRLLGLPIIEKDYVVVGATETEMLEAGYRSVGRAFPVFLHPDTAEEYALTYAEARGVNIVISNPPFGERCGRTELGEIARGFDNEVAPTAVELEGRVVTLEGNLEQRYRDWRRILRQIYELEVGPGPAGVN